MVMVIGASGFIGTYVVDELIGNGYSVLGTGRNESAQSYYKDRAIPFMNLDITKSDSFRELPTRDIEAVVLLAALLPANVRTYDPQQYIDTNINGTLNTLEYCRKNGIKKIISTTSYADVMNSWKVDPPVSEEVPRNFKMNDDHTMYVISKNAASDIIYHYNEFYNMSGCVFRLPPVIGWGPHAEIYIDGKYYKSGFQVFLEKSESGEDIEIFGDSSIIRDIVGVKDVARATRLAIESDNAKGLYNITSGYPLSLDEQVRTMVEFFSPSGRPSMIKYKPEKKNNSKPYLFSIEKAKKDFGYSPIYIPFVKILEDYRKERELDRVKFLTQARKKVHQE